MEISLGTRSSIFGTTDGFKWSKPSVGVLKCNLDAGLFLASCKVGHGYVIRDYDGIFVAVRSFSDQCRYLIPIVTR